LIYQLHAIPRSHALHVVKNFLASLHGANEAIVSTYSLFPTACAGFMGKKFNLTYNCLLDCLIKRWRMNA